MRYSGEVVYIYGFDIAYDTTREPLRTTLGRPVSEFAVDARKHSPGESFFYHPQMVRLDPVEKRGPGGKIQVARTVKFLPLGALSITVRVPFEVDALEELVDYHELKLDGERVQDWARGLARRAQAELRPWLIRPVETIGDGEAYTVFCIGSPLTDEAGYPAKALDWLKSNGPSITAVLTQERDSDKLSDQEIAQNTGQALSFYDRDLSVIDWDAAIIVDDPMYFDETLHIMELANFELAELEAYDSMLDESLERAYRDVADASVWGRREVRGQLREIRLDLARLSDELSNITKFFGDWHLARVYQQLASRFHLADWYGTVQQKLKTLDDLYELINADRLNWWMVVLEATIVLLFVADLILLFLIR